MIRFSLMFGLLMAAYYAIAVTQTFDAMLYQILRANAWVSWKVLNFLGMRCTLSETAIRSARFAVNVRRGCDAVEPVWFFASAVISFPGALTRKLVGIVIGGSVIAVANVVRITSLFLVGLYFPKFFPSAHLEIWPAALVLLACLLFISWIAWTRRASGHASN